MPPIISSLKIPNIKSYLAPSIAYAQELAKASGFDENEVRQIALALEEAIMNVIEHGFEPGESATFDLVCEQSAASLTFIIREKGMPFDTEKLKAYDPAKASEEFSAEGLGLFLMQKSMDEVVFRNLGRDGKETRLTKHKANARIDRLVESAELEPYGEQAVPAEPKTVQDIRIHALLPQEAIEVSRCAYKAYGYSYDEYIYYPEKIVELNRLGLMHSLVAVTDKDEIAGHIAIKRKAQDSVIAELGVAFVKPEFRGSGVFNALSQAALEKAREEKLECLFGRAVTSHAVSQKTSNRIGFKDCGILLGQLPGDLQFKRLTSQVIQRESAVLCLMPLRKLEPRTIYPPVRHNEMIRSIYSSLGMHPEFPTPPPEPDTPPPNHTEMDAAAINSLNTAEIHLLEYGADAFTAVYDKLRDFCLEHRDVVYLFLDLENPLTAAWTSAFEKANFFFAGVFPRGLDNRDALILQYLNNTNIRYDALKLFSPEAVKLRDYIEKNDRESRRPHLS